VQSCSDFLEPFAEKLNFLLRHSFIAQQQSWFYKELKLTLKTGGIAVICYFPENYSIIQHEAEGLQWNNAEATLHTFVPYYAFFAQCAWNERIQGWSCLSAWLNSTTA
jgi:hypothetical protein